MKKYLGISAVVFLGFVSCGKNCEESKMATCLETPPVEELCHAYFARWFYNNNTNKCEFIGYSGCSQLGFATEEECEACECD